MAKSSLATAYYAAYSGNYSQSRYDCHIEMITIHHMAGVLTAAQCGNIFATPGRCGSSHYGIGYNGEIACYVDENDTSWANSNWESNKRAVTIETSNSYCGGDYPVSDAALNSLIKLVADIAKRNNLGTLVPGQNLTWHSMYASTECPGNYLRSKMQYIADEANKINNPTPITIETIDNISILINTPLINFEEGNTIKDYDANTKIDNIVAIATKGDKKYYMTLYSYSNNIHNGFDINGCTIYEEPKVEEDPIKEEQEEKIPEDEIIEIRNQDKKNPLVEFIKLIIILLQKLLKKEDK